MSVFRYTELVDPNNEAGASSTPKAPITPPPATCNRSPTLVNGKSACQGELIFEENFNTLDPAKWENDVRIAGSPVSGRPRERTSADVEMTWGYATHRDQRVWPDRRERVSNSV
jgi:hypothetical protein